MTKCYFPFPGLLTHIASTAGLLLLFFCQQAYSQTQVGSDIYGEMALDRLGAAVALSADGNRLAASAQFNDGNENDAGHARVYEWDGEDWIQLGADIDGDATNDFLGQSLDLSADGNRLVVSAMHNDEVAFNAGHVRIFDWDGNAWTQAGTDINGQAEEERFGWQVKLTPAGDRLAIGTISSDITGSSAGHVNTYDWINNDWVQIGSSIIGEGSDEHTGYSVVFSADGNRMVLSATAYNAGATNTGRVSTYDWVNEDWVLAGNPIDGENAQDRLGHAAALSADGNILAISSLSHDGVNGDLPSVGQVKVFSWTNDQWSQLGDDLYGIAEQDRFGYSMALSADGQRLIVSTLGSDENGEDAGKVQIFDWLNEAWTPTGMDMLGDEADDSFGYAVALTDDGNRIAVGAILNNGNFSNSGQVKVFDMMPVATTDNTLQAVRVFPNPSQGIIQIDGIENGQVRIIDQLGRLRYTNTLQEQGIDMSGWPSGWYLLQISSGSQIISKRIVKK